MLDEEGADGDDAGEGVQLAPEEGVALAGAEGLDAAECAARQEVLAVRLVAMEGSFDQDGCTCR